jgi:Asp-tRNA(Asn)/Glu-tRNA(Gln) amidotransferase A subunit family amidase
MSKRFVIAAAFVLSTAVAATAQPQPLPPGKWWKKPEIVQQLALNAEQQERLEEIYRGAAEELIDLKAEVEKASLGLRGELDRATLDRAAILRAGQRLDDARGKLFLRELAMLVDMRGALTAPQWTKMKAALERFDERRPGGPPPHRRP